MKDEEQNEEAVEDEATRMVGLDHCNVLKLLGISEAGTEADCQGT
jgi:hypothetical protein